MKYICELYNICGLYGTVTRWFYYFCCAYRGKRQEHNRAHALTILDTLHTTAELPVVHTTLFHDNTVPIPARKGPRAENAVLAVTNIPHAAGTRSSSTQSVTKMGLMPYRPPSRRPVTMNIASRWFAVVARGTVKKTIPDAAAAA